MAVYHPAIAVEGVEAQFLAGKRMRVASRMPTRQPAVGPGLIIVVKHRDAHTLEFRQSFAGQTAINVNVAVADFDALAGQADQALDEQFTEQGDQDGLPAARP